MNTKYHEKTIPDPEPMAARREAILSKPGGASALAIRRGGLRLIEGMSEKLYANSPTGRSSRDLLLSLKDSQTGATGVILCNGPSLNQTELEAIGDAPTILMNRGYLLWNRLPAPPTLLCISADLVIEQYEPEISALDVPLILSKKHLRYTARRDKSAFLQPSRNWGFATEIGLQLHLGYTVTYWALQMAYHLGWSKAIIVGMDHRYDQTGDPTKEVTTRGNDANHFDPNYFQDGARWLLPALEMNEYSYRLANSAFRADNREIVDCTVNGACHIFRRSDLRTELSS